MRIASLCARSYPIPFRQVFRHASATRSAAETVLVVARDSHGTIGIGEGCPRSYVTGETVESALAFVSAHAADLMRNVTSSDALAAWIESHDAVIDSHPAAFCAVELALLDLLGREQGEPLEALLGLQPLKGAFRYTAVLGNGPPDQVQAQAHRYWANGFRDFKLKLSGDLREDRVKIIALRAFDDGTLRLRLDANNLWSGPDDCVDFLHRLNAAAFAIEEPVAADDLKGCRRIADALGVRIILDESCLRLSQIAALEPPADRWIVNLRVSKLGGLIRSLAMAREATRLGIGIIVGAHVGETSLLTRAGLTLAQAVGPRLLAQEGAFGTLLLEEEVCSPPLMFGSGGALAPDNWRLADRAGSGLEMDVAALPRLSAG